MPENNSANGRLDSWKEIADYLKRDVRTAIRWEKERGLPIHRVPGGKRQAVFAHQQEIDAWMGSQTKSPSEQAEGRKDIFARLGRRTLAISAACLLLMIGIGGWLSRSTKASVIRPVSFNQVTDDGRLKTTLRTDGTTLYFTAAEGARSILMTAPVSGSPISRIDTPFNNVSLQDLSRDGKTLLLVSYEGIWLEGPLWTMPTQGGKPHRVGEAVCTFARWSPDNSKIACARGTTLTVMNSEGGNERNVEVSALPVGPLLWSPDGRRLRFVLEQATEHIRSQWEIDTSEGAAAQARALAFGNNCCWDWTWTRDSKKFVYTQFDRAGKSHLRIQDGSSDSSSYELPVDIGPLWTAAPGADPDSLFLLISTSYRGELLEFDGKQQTLRPYLPGLSAVFIAFSPDGQWITYAKTQDQTLWRSRVDGSEARQLTKPPMEVEVSAWSPDGRRIAFMGSMPGKPWRLYLVERDGGAMQEAAAGVDSQGGPSWSPDGKFIAYGNVDCEKTQSCWIRRLELASGKTEIIPGSSGLRTARWSPDGKYIAALRPETHELMLFGLRSQVWLSLANSVTGDNINWSSDSQFIYIDCPREAKPVIERIRVRDARRETAVSLDSLKSAPGTISPWFGLAPDNAPILAHLFTGAEVYELKWGEQR
jgi:Tol biopolymer transport system component